MIRKMLAILGVILIAAGGSGCAMAKQTSEEVLIARLEKKYREKFTFVRWDFKEMGGMDATALVECESLPEKKIQAGQTEGEGGELQYFDNYMGYLYENEIEKKIARITKKVYAESKVFFQLNTTLLPMDADSNKTFTELIQNTETLLSVQIVVCQSWEPEKKELQLEKWREEMEKEKLRVKGILVVTEDTGLFQEIEQSKTLRIDEVGERFQGYCYMAMDKAYEFYYADWRTDYYG